MEKENKFILYGMLLFEFIRPRKLIVLALLVWAFFQAEIASIIFIVLIIFTEGYQFIIDKSGRPKTNQLNLNEDEFEALKKYHIYFRFPLASKSISSALSGVQMSSCIWVPWLLYNQLWWQAAFIAMNFFIASHLARKLNPEFFLHDNLDRKQITDISPNNQRKIQWYIKTTKEMEAVDSLSKKIFQEKICLKDKKCLCADPQCAKCLVVNCEDDNCKIHTIEAKLERRRRFLRGNPTNKELEESIKRLEELVAKKQKPPA